MKIDSAVFQASALDLEACPASHLPEFAFVGRSNVGKSSLINMLTGKSELAHTSSKPGKTQLINFFKINHSWNLVDLPGYGYAKLSKKKQEDFNIHVSGYLLGRESLKQIFVLVDSQLEPLDGDLAFIDWLQDCELPYSVIFTKTDRGSNSTAKNHAEQFAAELTRLELKPTEVFSCSAKTRKGRNDILQWIDAQLPRKTKKKKGKSVNLGWMK